MVHFEKQKDGMWALTPWVMWEFTKSAVCPHWVLQPQNSILNLSSKPKLSSVTNSVFIYYFPSSFTLSFRGLKTTFFYVKRQTGFVKELCPCTWGARMVQFPVIWFRNHLFCSHQLYSFQALENGTWEQSAPGAFGISGILKGYLVFHLGA